MRISDWSSDVCSSDLAAVVGDQQESAGIALQKAFQPERGFEVEVVGRLVEQQQVGGLEQEGGEGHPHAPAAGELGAGALLGSLVEAEPGQDTRGAGRGGVGADGGQTLVQRSEEHTSELQSLMRISYAVFCLKKKNI